MIKLNSELKSFEVANSFSDITFEQYNEIMSPNVTQFRQIEILTGLQPAEAVVLDLEILSDHLAFLKEDPFESIEPNDFLTVEGVSILLPSDIGEKSWEQQIVASEAMRENKPLSVLACYVQPIFKNSPFVLDELEDIEFKLSKIPMHDLFAAANFIKNQLIEIEEKERELLKSDISYEQIRAGIDMFNQLGVFNTIDLIAGGDVLKYDAVLKIDYNTILNKLFKLNLTAKFEKNYHEIIKETNQ